MVPNSSSSSTLIDPTKFYHIRGNTPLSQAEVICVADIPSNYDIQTNNSLLIDKIWNGHFLLIEHFSSDDAHQSSAWFRDRTKVSGWDIPGAQATLNKWKEQESSIRFLATEIDEMYIHSDWRRLVKASPAWHRFLQVIPDRLKGESKRLLRGLDGGYSQDLFAKRLVSLVIETESDLRAQMATEYENTFQARLSSLQLAVENALKIHQKVIVSLSANFVIRNRRLTGESFDLEPFMEYLEKKKYVIINAKRSPLKLEDQPNLWDFSQTSTSSVADDQQQNGNASTSGVPSNGTSNEARAGLSDDSSDEDTDLDSEQSQVPKDWHKQRKVIRLWKNLKSQTSK